MKVTTVWCALPDTGAQPSSGDVRSLVTENQGKLFIAAVYLGTVHNSVPRPAASPLEYVIIKNQDET